jgi:uncharacterized membrane protein YfcA
MQIPRRLGAALVAWLLLIIYLALMKDFVNDAKAVTPAVVILDEGLTKVAVVVGTGVIGVIAGMFGVEAPAASAMATLRRTPLR